MSIALPVELPGTAGCVARFWLSLSLLSAFIRACTAGKVVQVYIGWSFFLVGQQENWVGTINLGKVGKIIILPWLFILIWWRHLWVALLWKKFKSIIKKSWSMSDKPFGVGNLTDITLPVLWDRTSSLTDIWDSVRSHRTGRVISVRLPSPHGLS